MKKYVSLFEGKDIKKVVYSRLKKIIDFPEEEWQDMRIINPVNLLKQNFSKYVKLFELSVNEALSKNYFDLFGAEQIKLADNLIKKYFKLKDMDKEYFRSWLREIIYSVE